MRLVVGLGEVLPVEVGVDLSRADAGAAEHFLHYAQVAGGLQHVGGKRVNGSVPLSQMRSALGDWISLTPSAERL